MFAGKIYDYIDSIAPFSGQAEWDNSGFLVGERGAKADRILFALDATAQVIHEAVEKNCTLLITHHPILFNPVKAFTEADPAYLAAKHGISVICAHTSYDFAAGGVADVLCAAVGLTDVRASECGEFRIGKTTCSAAQAFAQTVKAALHAQVFVALPQKQVETVAVCGGAGASFLHAAKEQGADLLLTGEAKHHEMLDAAAQDIALVVAGHFETERPAICKLRERVQAAFPETVCLLSEQVSPVQIIE